MPVGKQDFFPEAKGVNAISGEWATAVQIYSVTGLTDAELRRLANGNNPNPKTGQAWIPKPVKGKYNFELTLIGVVQWLMACKAEGRPEHPVYASMEVAASLGLIPRGFQKWCASQGVDFKCANGNVKSEGLRRKAFEVLDKMFANGTPSVSGLDGFQELDLKIELAKKAREEHIKLADDRELRQRQLVNAEVVEEEIYEKFLGPAREKMAAAWKNLRREHRTILAAGGVQADLISRIEEADQKASQVMLQAMAKSLTKRRKSDAKKEVKAV